MFGTSVCRHEFEILKILLYSLITNIAQMVHSPLIMPLETGEL